MFLELFHTFLETSYNFLVVISLLCNFIQLNAVLPFDFKFLLQLSDMLSLLALLIHDLLLECIYVLVSNSQVVFSLLMLLRLQAFLPLVVIFDLLNLVI